MITRTGVGLLVACCCLLLTAFGCSGHRQPTPVTFEVNDQEFLIDYARTRRFSRGLPRSIRITPQNDAILFLRSPADSPVQDLYVYDVADGSQRVLLTADQILAGESEQLSAEELARRERMRLSARGITSYSLSRDGRLVLVPLSGELFVINRQSGDVQRLTSDGGFPIDARFSPDAKKVACVRDGDLYVIDIESGSQQRLTHRTGEHITNGLSEFVAQEEMGRFAGYWWSPDSRHIAYQQTDTSRMETMHIGDALRPNTPPHSWPYPRPGRRNADVRVGLILSLIHI